MSSYLWFYPDNARKAPPNLMRGRWDGRIVNGDSLAVWYQWNGKDHWCDSVSRDNVQGGYMNQVIIDGFPQTKDAVLIDKWFGSKLSDPLFALLLKGKEQDLLCEATRLEKESQANQR